MSEHVRDINILKCQTISVKLIAEFAFYQMPNNNLL